MKYSIKVFVRRSDEGGYIADCLEVDASAQGITLDDTVANLRRLLEEMLQGADMASFDLVEEPTLFFTFEDEPISTKGPLKPF